MSLFSALASAVLSGFQSSNPIVSGLAREVTSHFQQGNGAGLTNIIEQMTKGGLGDIAKSWVGMGPNKPVTPDQLNHALDKGFLEQLAAKLGIPPQLVTTHLAEILPKMVDKMTPDGKLPQADPGSTVSGSAATGTGDFGG